MSKDGWITCKQFKCRKCGAAPENVKYKEDDRGDAKYKCAACKKTWWVDGPDY